MFGSLLVERDPALPAAARSAQACGRRVASLLAGTGTLTSPLVRTDQPWSDVWLDRGAARPAHDRPRLRARRARHRHSDGGAGRESTGSPRPRATRPRGSAARCRVSRVARAGRALPKSCCRVATSCRCSPNGGAGRGRSRRRASAFGALHISESRRATSSRSPSSRSPVSFSAPSCTRRAVSYAAWAAHFAWNWTMAVVFHVAVSGLPLESPGYRYVDAGPDWATGGSWGPEGGAARRGDHDRRQRLALSRAAVD